MISCTVSDLTRASFAFGEAPEIEHHVLECEVCQAELERIWEGELEHDIAEPVLRAIRIDRFIRGVLEAGAGVASRLAQAAVNYGIGGDQP